MTQNPQIESLHQKLDLVLERLDEAHAQREQVDDLLADTGLITQDLARQTTTRLEAEDIRLDQDRAIGLLLRMANSVEQFHGLLDMVDSLHDLGADAGILAQQAGMDAVTLLGELEAKGYFRFLREMSQVMDKVVEHFGEEDLHELADNVVNILETVKRVTQPDMLEAVNNAIVVFRHVQTDDVTPMGPLRVMRELNSREARKGLGFLVAFLKNLGEQDAFIHPTTKTNPS